MSDAVPLKPHVVPSAPLLGRRAERSWEPCVVIVGAGFGGLWACGALRESPVEVTLLDRNNFHTFFPLLYQVAAAEIEPEQIAYPIRSIGEKLGHARFCMADVRSLDLSRRAVITDGPEFIYDYLVFAPGSVPHYFGLPGAAEHAFPLRTMDHAIAIRNHILSCFERAVRESDPARRRSLLTFTIVGGGPTGVEFAGALAELIDGPFRRDYPDLAIGNPHVLLMEATETLLAGQPPELGAYACGRLRSKGVEVRLRSAVAEIAPAGVMLKGGESIPSETVVWTAGVSGPRRLAEWGFPMARGGRVAVQPTLQVPGHPEVYVVGDSAYVEDGGQPLPGVAPSRTLHGASAYGLVEGTTCLPGVAPVAMQEGEWAARNILRQIAGDPPIPFRYHDLGTMAVIGRNAAVARIQGRTFTGFTAWALWLVVHLMRLIGFRNRLVVLSSWAWDYFFFERVVRLILPSTRPQR